MMKIKLIESHMAEAVIKVMLQILELLLMMIKDMKLLKNILTAERVKKHFEGICHGKVERFELPNLRALNFLLAQHSWWRRNCFIKT